jgi:hypothetical protein
VVDVLGLVLMLRFLLLIFSLSCWAACGFVEPLPLHTPFGDIVNIWPALFILSGAELARPWIMRGYKTSKPFSWSSRSPPKTMDFDDPETM